MPRFAAQLILNILCGDGDRVIVRGARNLAAKAEAYETATQIFTYQTSDVHAIAAIARQMPHPWRLYVYGHGDFAGQTVGDITVTELAQYLAHCGLANNVPDLVSVVSCQMALGLGQSTDRLERVASTNSFVARLHRALGETHHIYTTLHGRTMSLSTETDTCDGFSQQGRKVTENPVSGQFFRKQPYSKIVFDWDGRTQRARFAYSNPAFPDDLHF